LESVISDMREKTGMKNRDQEFDDLANESFKELKEMKEMQNLYK